MPATGSASAPSPSRKRKHAPSPSPSVDAPSGSGMPAQDRASPSNKRVFRPKSNGIDAPHRSREHDQGLDHKGKGKATVKEDAQAKHGQRALSKSALAALARQEGRASSVSTVDEENEQEARREERPKWIDSAREMLMAAAQGSGESRGGNGKAKSTKRVEGPSSRVEETEKDLAKFKRIAEEKEAELERMRKEIRFKDEALATQRSLLAAVRTAVTCAVCFESMTSPYTLSCGHTACYGCLISWFTRNDEAPNPEDADGAPRRSRKNVICPQCRTPVPKSHRPHSTFAVKDALAVVRAAIDRNVLAEDDDPAAAVVPNAPADGAARLAGEGGEVDWKGLFWTDDDMKKNARGMGGRAVFDAEDDVRRCPHCAWEIEDGACVGCGEPYEDSSEGEFGFGEDDDEDESNSDSDLDEEDEDLDDSMDDFIEGEDDDVPDDVRNIYFGADNPPSPPGFSDAEDSQGEGEEVEVLYDSHGGRSEGSGSEDEDEDEDEDENEEDEHGSRSVEEDDALDLDAQPPSPPPHPLLVRIRSRHFPVQSRAARSRSGRSILVSSEEEQSEDESDSEPVRRSGRGASAQAEDSNEDEESGSEGEVDESPPRRRGGGRSAADQRRGGERRGRRSEGRSGSRRIELSSD